AWQPAELHYGRALAQACSALLTRSAPLGPVARRWRRAAQDLIAVQRDVQVALEVAQRRDFHADRRARRERDRLREIAKRPPAVRSAEPGDIEDRLALQFAAARFVEQRVEKSHVLGRRAHHLEQLLQ